MNKKELKMQREKEEDRLLNKALWWIVGAVILECLLLLLNRYYTNYKATSEAIALAGNLRVVFKVLAVVLPICFVVLAVWYALLRKQQKNTGLAARLSMVALVLAVCAVVVALFGSSGIQLLYVVVPIAAALALVYYLYQREFFMVAVLCTLGLLGVYTIPRAALSTVVAYGYAVVEAVILLAAVLLARKLQTSKGSLAVAGRRIEVFPQNANYAMIYVTCGVCAVVLAAALLLGSMALLYGVLVAWLLIMAVYYTVRLM